jgi:hypothetical protein
MRTCWREALLDSPSLPTADGSLRRPEEIFPLPQSLPDAATAHELANLDCAHTLRPDVEQLAPINGFLTGVADTLQMGIGEFISLLTAPTRETAEYYFQFLVDWRESLGMRIVIELKKAPVVVGAAGQLLTPGSDTIFFPRERGDTTIPEDLPVPIAYVPDVHDVRNLLREVGIKSFEWRELIREYLIKILSDLEPDDDAQAGAVAGLRTYHQVRLQGS